jgi:hypothetical protein
VAKNLPSVKCSSAIDASASSFSSLSPIEEMRRGRKEMKEEEEGRKDEEGEESSSRWLTALLTQLKLGCFQRAVSLFNALHYGDQLVGLGRQLGFLSLYLCSGEFCGVC